MALPDANALRAFPSGVPNALKAFPSGVPNAKYLAFGTPNTKNHLTVGVLNAKTFGTNEQYRSKFGTIRTQMPNQKKNFLFHFFSLLSILYSIFLFLLTNLSLSLLTRVLSLSLFLL